MENTRRQLDFVEAGERRIHGLDVERVKGIEPSSQAWEARILPLNHTRFATELVTNWRAVCN